MAASWTGVGELLVFDVVAPKVVRLGGPSEVVGEISVDPSFTGPVVASGELIWAGLEPDGDVLLTERQPRTDAASSRNLVGWAIRELEAGAERADTVSATELESVEVSWTSDWTLPARPRPLAATNAQGELVTAATDGTYRLLVRDSTGTAVRQICRDAGPLPLTPVERGEALPEHVRGAREASREHYEELRRAISDAGRPRNPAPFGRLVIGSDGRIWVQRERSSGYPGGLAGIHGVPAALHDVFSADGSYLGEVRMPEGETLAAALGDTIWTLEVGDLGETWVRARKLSLEPQDRPEGEARR